MPDWRGRLKAELGELPLPPGELLDVVEELALDLEERARTARAAGADVEEAEARAWAGLGSLEDLKARLRAQPPRPSSRRPASARGPLGGGPGAPPWSGLGQDVGHALRTLRRNPGFATVAVLTLALGIGANAILFSLVSALFLTPLPVRERERVVTVFTSDYSGPRYGNSSYPDYEDLKGQAGLFEWLSGYTFEALALLTDREPARVWSELVTGDYFAGLSLPMALGRPLSRSDDLREAAPAVVISHGLWKRRLGGDPSVLGRTLSLSGSDYTVVGVAVEGFTGLTRGVSVEAWIPLALRPRIVPGRDALANRGSRFLSLIGRLAPGVTAADAQARLDLLASQLRATYPDTWTDRTQATRKLTLLREHQSRIVPAARGAVMGFSALLAVVVAVVLLIACANVANIMLARAFTRRREMAVRLALGASRIRLVRHFVTESLLVTGLGGALGVGLALWASQALRAFIPPLPVPMHLEVVVDARVMAFTLALTLLTGVGLGLVPALAAASPDLVPALKDEGGGVASGRRGRRLRRGFVSAQVALSLVLLVGAGLLLRGLFRATRLTPGFDAETTHLVPVDLGLAGYDVARASALVDRLAEEAASLPGLRAVALSATLPLEIHVSRRGTRVEGYTPAVGEEMEFPFGVVGPGHLEAFRIPLLRGREFTPADRADSPGVAIVNETFAARFWPGQDPIGRIVQVRGEDGPRLTVVGLARDSTYRTLGEEPTPFLYLPLAQEYDFARRFARLFPLHVVVRGDGDPAALTRGVKAVLQAFDPKLPAYGPKSMMEHLGLSVLPARLASILFASFGLLGLLLASLGVYGVVAYSASERTQEMGVRIALGASRGDVLGLVLRDGLAITAWGLGIGLILAAALAQALRALLYGLSSLDPVTFALVPLLLVAVAALASLLPALRASRVDPVVALRYE